MDGLFTFIKDRFLSMPQWVQVITYLSFVSLFIYLITAPRFLDMRLVSNDYGDEFPIGGAQIEVEIEGRVLILLTDNKGRFSVPISTHYPMGSYVFILSPDPSSQKIKEIEVPVSNSYLNRSKIIYSKKTSNYQIVPNGVLENTKTIFASLNPINSAYADEKPVDVKNDGIDVVILTALEKITQLPAKKISYDLYIYDDLNLDNIDLSYISHQLNKQYNIDTFKQFQRRAETVEDLITIARKVFYKQETGFEKNSAIYKNKITLKDMPAEIATQYKQALLLRKTNYSAEAIELLKPIVKAQSYFYLAWFNLALSYVDVNNIAAADEAFKQAIIIGTARKMNNNHLNRVYGLFLLNLQQNNKNLVNFKSPEK